jgi:hypothetical protein
MTSTVGSKIPPCHIPAAACFAIETSYGRPEVTIDGPTSFARKAGPFSSFLLGQGGMAATKQLPRLFIVRKPPRPGEVLLIFVRRQIEVGGRERASRPQSVFSSVS